MKGFIYLTKEFNSDGVELKHNDITKIGVGKTNDLSRRFKEHHNKGSKSTTEVDFIKTFEVDNVGVIVPVIVVSTAVVEAIVVAVVVVA